MSWSRLLEVDPEIGRRFVADIHGIPGRFSKDGRWLLLHDTKQKRIFVVGVGGTLAMTIATSAASLAHLGLEDASPPDLFFAGRGGKVVHARVEPWPEAHAPRPPLRRIGDHAALEAWSPADAPQHCPEPCSEGALWGRIRGWAHGVDPNVTDGAAGIEVVVLDGGLLHFFDIEHGKLRLAHNYLVSRVERVDRTESPSAPGATRLKVTVPSGATVFETGAAFADAIVTALREPSLPVAAPRAVLPSAVTTRAVGGKKPTFVALAENEAAKIPTPATLAAVTDPLVLLFPPVVPMCLRVARAHCSADAMDDARSWLSHAASVQLRITTLRRERQADAPMPFDFGSFELFGAAYLAGREDFFAMCRAAGFGASEKPYTHWPYFGRSLVALFDAPADLVAPDRQALADANKWKFDYILALLDALARQDAAAAGPPLATYVASWRRLGGMKDVGAWSFFAGAVARLLGAATMREALANGHRTGSDGA